MNVRPLRPLFPQSDLDEDSNPVARIVVFGGPYLLDVAQNPASKIHVVTRAYLAGWAPPPDCVLRPWSIDYGRQKPKSPAAVGWVRDWWSDEDPALNEACEKACRPLEGTISEVLRSFEDRWPLGGSDLVRGLVAQFIALHVIRTDASKRWFAEARDESLARLEAEWDNSKLPFSKFRAAMSSDHERAKKLLALINKLASGFASMHWTLLRFEDPWLITSDHPVCAVPILDGDEQAEVRPTPSKGWINTVEVRFPLTPRLVLLGSWHAGPELSGPVAGTWQHAVNLNGAARAQAGRQWFHDPTRMPPLPPAIYRKPSVTFEPVTPHVIPGYSSAAAKASPLGLLHKARFGGLGCVRGV